MGRVSSHQAGLLGEGFNPGAVTRLPSKTCTLISERLCRFSEHAPSESTVLEAQLGNLDTSFGGIEDLDQLVEMHHLEPVRLKTVSTRIELSIV